MDEHNFTTVRLSLYGKRLRELKSSVVFGITASVLLFVFAFIIFVSNFVLFKVYVSGSSMFPTLKSGDILSVNPYLKADYGDVIVISGEENYWLIKRAIAFGGDTVKIKDGAVSLKKAGETAFTKLTEPYLDAQVKTVWDDPRADGFLVPEGQIFYLGDNRKYSKDSRSEFGTCDREQIVGVVSKVALKFKDFNRLLDSIVSPVKKMLA